VPEGHFYVNGKKTKSGQQHIFRQIKAVHEIKQRYKRKKTEKKEGHGGYIPREIYGAKPCR